MITFTDVCFSYGPIRILECASFTIEKGEFVALVGPNGSGKSTAIRLMLGLLKPDEGRVLLGVKPSEVGYVPQALSFDAQFPITVKEVVLGGLLSTMSWLGRYRFGDRKKAHEALERVGMAAHADSPFSALSGGQRQRVLIARALAGNPKMLVLDEPTAHVDHHTEHLILDLLKHCEQTVVLVTHDFEHAVKQVDRVLLFQKKITSHKPEELCKHYAMGLYHEAKGKGCE